MRFFLFFLVMAGLLAWGTPSVDAATYGALYLTGGGRCAPGTWHDEPIKWLLKGANNGHIVILSTNEDDERMAEYYRQLGAETASFFRVWRRWEADDPAIYTQLTAADGLMIMSSDITTQLNIWHGTRTESAVRDVLEAGKPVLAAGTAAQLFGGLILDRTGGQLQPAPLLRKPTIASFTFTDSSFDRLPNVIVEPAFSRQAQWPIMALALACRRLANTASLTVGLGIDENTGLILDENLRATVVGEGAVTIMMTTASMAVRLDERRPPLVTEVDFYSFTEGFLYDLAAGQILAAPPDADVSAVPAEVAVLQNVFFRGSASSTRRVGAVEIANTDHEPLALQLGILNDVQGTSQLGAGICVPEAFADIRYAENRAGGLLWGLARHPAKIGLLLDTDSAAEFSSAGLLRPQPVTNQAAIMVVDPRTTVMRAFSKRKSWPDGNGPRQAVALVGARLHLLTTYSIFNLNTGTVQVLP